MEHKQVKHYLPMHTTTRVWSDRVKLVRVPMFPSYVFVNLTSLSDYFEGLNADGVLQYVKFGGSHARVADGIIHNLQLVSNHGNEVEVSYSRFEEGQQLTIHEGPFSGMHCEVVRINNKEKILVRVGLLQRNVLMELPATNLTTPMSTL